MKISLQIFTFCKQKRALCKSNAVLFTLLLEQISTDSSLVVMDQHLLSVMATKTHVDHLSKFNSSMVKKKLSWQVWASSQSLVVLFIQDASSMMDQCTNGVLVVITSILVKTQRTQRNSFRSPSVNSQQKFLSETIKSRLPQWLVEFQEEESLDKIMMTSLCRSSLISRWVSNLP